MLRTALDARIARIENMQAIVTPEEVRIGRSVIGRSTLPRLIGITGTDSRRTSANCRSAAEAVGQVPAGGGRERVGGLTACFKFYCDETVTHWMVTAIYDPYPDAEEKRAALKQRTEVLSSIVDRRPPMKLQGGVRLRVEAICCYVSLAARQRASRLLP